jgi:hypothetical protein
MLDQLEDNLRRLKIEYEVFFNGGSKTPPSDLEWRVQTAIKKFNEGGRLTFQQRFRYNTLTQRYATLNTQWQKKIRIKEEGYRRPQDALLGVHGVRAAATPDDDSANEIAIRIRSASAESDHIRDFFHQMTKVRAAAGMPAQGDLEGFRHFIARKTAELQKQYGCEEVEYSLKQTDEGLRLNAKPITNK